MDPAKRVDLDTKSHKRDASADTHDITTEVSESMEAPKKKSKKDRHEKIILLKDLPPRKDITGGSSSTRKNKK